MPASIEKYVYLIHMQQYSVFLSVNDLSIIQSVI